MSHLRYLRRCRIGCVADAGGALGNIALGDYYCRHGVHCLAVIDDDDRFECAASGAVIDRTTQRDLFREKSVRHNDGEFLSAFVQPADGLLFLCFGYRQYLLSFRANNGYFNLRSRFIWASKLKNTRFFAIKHYLCRSSDGRDCDCDFSDAHRRARYDFRRFREV